MTRNGADVRIRHLIKALPWLVVGSASDELTPHPPHTDHDPDDVDVEIHE
ncbi:MAG: hypothetical protein L0Y44_04050 [Phycisphaerales bacterium]|nr:hypothetical protein [Phycisphaerales bacterium]MCI0629810.1 hypothetical protein [Phycisphaerales bacterium]